MDCPALRSSFAVSGRTPLFSSPCGIEPLFNRIAGWIGGELDIELPPEWEEDWPADIEKPRSFGKNRDLSLGLLLARPDPKEQPRQFVLRLVRRLEGVGNFQVDFAVGVHPERDDMCLMTVEAGAAALRPPGGDVLRLPSLVAQLLADFCCRAGLEIGPASRPIENADDLLEMIESQERTLPVVVAEHGAAAELAESMAGLAHYWHHADSRAAVRIGVGADDDGRAQVFWPGATRSEAAPAGIGYLPVLLASASLLRDPAGGAGVWEALQRSKLRRQLGKAEKQARAADPAADRRDEINRLNRKLREAREDSARLKGELDRAHRDLGWLLRADAPLDALKQMSDGGVHIESVRQAIEAARLDYAGEIDFDHIDYHDEADQFDSSRHVFLVLKWLARRYVPARRGGGGGDLAASCKEFSGFEYVSGQSKTTVGMYQHEYQFSYRGRQVIAEEHLRWGVSRDPRLILRISFYYDEQENKVVLHYFGRHQRNQVT